MHIGIDARMIGTKQGGIGRYIFELVKRIPAINLNDRYTIFVKPDSKLPPLSSNVTVIKTDIHWYTLAEQIQFPAVLAQHPVDLMHFPHWNIPLSYNKPFIVTIHDLILKHFPSRKASTLGFFTYTFKHAAYNAVLRHAAHDARHILTVSEFSRRDIHTTLGVPLEKISAFYLGCAQSLTSPSPSFAGGEPAAAPPLQRGGWEGSVLNSYILAVGVQYPHKKLDRLIRAFESIKNKIPHNLVIAGPEGPFSKTLQETDRIHFIKSPTDDELKNLYQNAHVFAFPSEYEGFGLPPLEAQAHGVPVIANNVTAMPEILKDSALLIEPTDEAWKQGLLKIINDEQQRNDLIQKGMANLKRFSFETLASSTHTAYHQIIKKGV